jgi:hypothetical protein
VRILVRRSPSPRSSSPSPIPSFTEITGIIDSIIRCLTIPSASIIAGNITGIITFVLKLAFPAKFVLKPHSFWRGNTWILFLLGFVLNFYCILNFDSSEFLSHSTWLIMHSGSWLSMYTEFWLLYTEFWLMVYTDFWLIID